MADDKIIIRVDGGICSQLHSVATGLLLREKFGPVVSVEYDLSWFDEDGKDCDGRFVRNWDVPKAFPDLEIKVADPKYVRIYRARYRNESYDIDTYAAPAFVNAYPNALAYMIGHAGILRGLFRPELDCRRKETLAEMRNAERPVCAVHVRRGDLAVASSPIYGQPTTLMYYQKAIELVRKVNVSTRFYFFSDEPRWVQDVLLPALPAIDSRIVSGESESDKGYQDLYLITKADFIISSIGSLGIIGGILAEKCRLLILSRPIADVLSALPFAICLQAEPQNLKCDQNMRRNGLYKPFYKLWKSLGKFLRERNG